ncbi:MAG: Queuine tRNA-ribosyltransferase, partial [Parcubacteria group bacterium GW2011_GWA2_38_13]
AGVDFQDPQNGKRYHISPETAMQIQNTIGSDIIMVFDECPPYLCKKIYAQASLELTTRWAKRCMVEFNRIKNQESRIKGKLIFGIVQGGVYKDLRIKAARELVAMSFSAKGGPALGWDGYAIGGVAVGEPREKLKKVLEWVLPELPDDKPRYLMGLGRPEEIVYAVKQGIDMFDCVIPTREARHGRLYLCKVQNSKFKTQSLGKNFYNTINIKNAKFATDMSPINNSNLKQYTKAYLHHLFRTNELLGMRLATLNNLEFYLTLMRNIRNQIEKGTF